MKKLEELQKNKLRNIRQTCLTTRIWEKTTTLTQHLRDCGYTAYWKVEVDEVEIIVKENHCVKVSKYGPEITPYLDTFSAVNNIVKRKVKSQQPQKKSCILSGTYKL